MSGVEVPPFSVPVLMRVPVGFDPLPNLDPVGMLRSRHARAHYGRLHRVTSLLSILTREVKVGIPRSARDDSNE